MNNLFTIIIVMIAAREAKKVKEKVKKLSTKVEEEHFDDDLEMVNSVVNWLIG